MIYFVRTEVQKLNRSFRSSTEARKYIRNLQGKAKDIKLLVNDLS